MNDIFRICRPPPDDEWIRLWQADGWRTDPERQARLLLTYGCFDQKVLWWNFRSMPPASS